VPQIAEVDAGQRRRRPDVDQRLGASSYTAVMLFTSRYALQRHGPKRLVVRRTRTWDEVVVRLDAVELIRTNKEALREGVEHRLYDHSVLRLWIEPGPRGSFFLMITRNGHPLPESDGDPVKILRFTLIMIWLVAGTQMLFSLVVIRNGGADPPIYWALGLGSMLVMLGVFAWHRSVLAMIGACALFFGEVTVFFAEQSRLNFGNVWSLLFGLGLVGWLLLRGIKAVRDLKAISLPIRRPPDAA
jgi:hypothetical protein